MSHTDNTDPYWVRGLHDPHRKIHHGYDCEEAPATWGFVSKLRPCNVDKYRGKIRSYRNCYYAPNDHRAWWAGYGPPRWYINHVWDGPKRVEERVKLRKAAQQYNATGEIDDIVFEHEQHHHGAKYYWW